MAYNNISVTEPEQSSVTSNNQLLKLRANGMKSRNSNTNYSLTEITKPDNNILGP